MCTYFSNVHILRIFCAFCAHFVYHILRKFCAHFVHHILHTFYAYFAHILCTSEKYVRISRAAQKRWTHQTRDASNFKNKPIYTLIMPYIQKKDQETWWKSVNSHISRDSSSGWWASTSIPKTILSATKFPTILVIIIFSISVLEIFSKNLSRTSIWPLWPLYDHLFDHISGSNGPILLIFELSVTNSKSFKKRFIKIGSDLLELSWWQTDRRTDRQTDGIFFFHFSLIWV